MKSLYESLLDNLDTIEKNSNTDVIQSIEEFIKTNYYLDRGVKYTISDQPNENGKYVVDMKGCQSYSCSFVLFKGKGSYLTNDLFEFGEFYGCAFNCSESNILSLKGAPKEIDCEADLTLFDCSNCKNLKSLEGGPKRNSGRYKCSNCKNLKSLKGAPEVQDGKFSCSGCTSLKTLEGAPKEIYCGGFDCSGCTSLKSLEGGPKEVHAAYDCSDCTSLKSLKGSPKEAGQLKAENCPKLDIDNLELGGDYQVYT